MDELLFTNTFDMIISELLTEGNYDVATQGVFIELPENVMFITRTELRDMRDNKKLSRSTRDKVRAVLDILEEQAKEEAISGYARMFLGGHSYRSNRELGYNDRSRRRDRMLPIVEVEEYGRRGRSRDSMGRFK